MYIHKCYSWFVSWTTRWCVGESPEPMKAALPSWFIFSCSSKHLISLSYKQQKVNKERILTRFLFLGVSLIQSCYDNHDFFIKRSIDNQLFDCRTFIWKLTTTNNLQEYTTRWFFSAGVSLIQFCYDNHDFFIKRSLL